MKRTWEELRDYATSLVDDIEFIWNGIHGLIIPFTREKFILAVGEDDDGTEFSDIDALLNFPCLHGYSIREVCDELVFLR